MGKPNTKQSKTQDRIKRILAVVNSPEEGCILEIKPGEEAAIIDSNNDGPGNVLETIYGPCFIIAESRHQAIQRGRKWATKAGPSARSKLNAFKGAIATFGTDEKNYLKIVDACAASLGLDLTPDDPLYYHQLISLWIDSATESLRPV